ncbi:MAG: hypothetical protein JWP95_334 [Actinotalea sp.]|nr:hypothetical protein [Actinotalea sp.]
MTDLAAAPLTRREIRLAEQAAAQLVEQAQAASMAATAAPATVPVLVPAAAASTAPLLGRAASPAPLVPPGVGPSTVLAALPDDVGGVASSLAPVCSPASALPVRNPESAEHLLLDDLRAASTRRRLVLPGARHGGRHGRRHHRHVTHRLRTGPVVAGSVLVLVTTLVTGGVSEAHAERVQRAELEIAIAIEQQQHEALTAGLNAEIERRVRAQDASISRLVAQGEAYAAGKRNQALLVARAAVETGGAVAVTVAPVVSPEDLTPLDQALIQLTALIETAPAPEVAPEPAAAPREETPIGVPQHDGQVAPGAPRATLEPAAVPTEVVPVDAPVSGTVLVPAPAAPAGDALDLAVSAQLVATAEQVAALSQQVQAVAAANIAAAEAAARAAAEAAAAAEATAAEQARRVRAVNDADNGAIPRELLCSVSFDRGVRLRCDAAAALEDLNAAYRAHFGTNLDISGSYRDYAAQVATKASRGGLAAAPGTSNHGRALAVDFGGFGGVGQFNLPTYRWMKANGPDFGWYHPPYMEPGGAGPAEPWHWEFGEL